MRSAVSEYLSRLDGDEHPKPADEEWTADDLDEYQLPWKQLVWEAEHHLCEGSCEESDSEEERRSNEEILARWGPQRALDEAAARELGFRESITGEMDLGSDS